MAANAHQKPPALERWTFADAATPAGAAHGNTATARPSIAAVLRPEAN